MNGSACNGGSLVTPGANNLVTGYTGPVNSWYQFERMQPWNILDLVVNAELNGTPGAFIYSTDYLNSSWSTNPLAVSGNPLAAANRTDDLQKVAEANQWNLMHGTWNSAASVPPPLQNLIIVRGGLEWNNTIPINMGGTTVSNIQIGFLFNSITAGDAQKTVPVIQWDSLALTGEQNLVLTFKQMGQFSLGIRAIVGGNPTMFELKMIVAP